MTNIIQTAALEIAAIKREYALFEECKLVRKGSEVEIYTSNLTLARAIRALGYEVYVA